MQVPVRTPDPSGRWHWRRPAVRHPHPGRPLPARTFPPPLV